jgi:integrase
MPTIQRRPRRGGRPHYRVQIRLASVPSRSATFPTLQEARQWAYATEGTLRTQRYAPRLEAAHHTLGELLQRYGREVLPTKSQGTAVNQALHLAWWHAQLGPVCLCEVTPPRLVACRDQLARDHAAGTVNQYLATLSHAFTVAVTEWQWLAASPMPRVRRLREPRGRVRYLTDEERPRLLAACQASRNRCLYAVVILALSIGARKMEILRLTWRDVDLQRVHSSSTRPRTGSGAPSP